MAGGQNRRAKRTEAFLKLAERIVTFPDGNFEPSPPPQILSKLTDEDLVLAADAVEAVAAKQQARPTGRAQFRLLAWSVADARGAATPLDKAVAETVGKRLDRQAKKVRIALESCEHEYRERRLIASDVDHAALDAAHRLEMETLRAEVYIGFHELETAAAGGAEEATAAPPQLATEPVLAAALQIAQRSEAQPRAPPDVAPIPPELCSRLKSEGVQYIWDFAARNAIYPKRSEDWHNKILPGCFLYTLLELAKRPSESDEDRMREIREHREHIEKLIEAREFIMKQDAYIASLEERLGIPPPE